MEVWTQVYNPLGNLALSALVAAIPIAFFFVALAISCAAWTLISFAPRLRMTSMRRPLPKVKGLLKLL